MLYFTILYYTILYYTILYYTILYYTILYYTILHYELDTSPWHGCWSCVGTSHWQSQVSVEASKWTATCGPPVTLASTLSGRQGVAISGSVEYVGSGRGR